MVPRKMNKTQFKNSIVNILNGSKTFADYLPAYEKSIMQRSSKLHNGVCQHHGSIDRSMGYNICDLSKILVNQLEAGKTVPDTFLIEFLNRVLDPVYVYSFKSKKGTECVTCSKYNSVYLTKLFDIAALKNIKTVYNKNNVGYRWKQTYSSNFIELETVVCDPYCNNKCINNYFQTFDEIPEAHIHNIFFERQKYLDKYSDKTVDPVPTDIIDACSKSLQKYNNDNFISLFSIRSYKLHHAIANIFDKYDGTVVVFDQNLLIAACRFLPYTLPIVQALLGKELIIDKKCVHAVLQFGNVEGIQFIIDRFDKNITSGHFNTLLNSKKYVGLTYSLYSNYKSHRTFSCDNYGYSIEKGSGYSDEAAKIFLNKGYKINKDNFIVAIKNNIQLQDIDKLGIKIDSEIEDICFRSSFYPICTFQNIDPKVIELQKLCIQPKISELRQFFKNNQNVEPNEKCMITAIKARVVDKTLQYLVANGGTITPKCLINHPAFKSITYRNLVKNAADYHDLKIKEYEAKIEKLEKQLKKYNSIKLVLNNYEPASKRKKIQVPKLFADYFELKKDIDKASFYELKNIMLAWFKKNNLIETTNEDKDIRINLPKDLTDKLGLDIGTQSRDSSYIVMDDIDNLIGYFF